MKVMILTVKGKEHDWCFEVLASPKYLEMWQQDGIDIHIIENVIPDSLPAFLIKPWCFFQNIFNFKNPFRHG